MIPKFLGHNCIIAHEQSLIHMNMHTYIHTYRHKLANTLPQIWIIGHMKKIFLKSFLLTAFAITTAFHINYSSWHRSSETHSRIHYGDTKPANKGNNVLMIFLLTYTFHYSSHYLYSIVCCHINADYRVLPLLVFPGMHPEFQ